MAKRFNEKSLAEAWGEYKKSCDSHVVKRSEFSQRESRFVTNEIPSPITYTVKGFCNFVGMTEQNFYKTYNGDEEVESVIARMKEECELDARRKFEDGSIPTQLSGLWMSNYGYSTSNKQEISVPDPVVITGGDRLED